ncbi:MAG: alpha/beta fold hydrolase, partial [Alphaproteobacteria bacterium]|nr:alpha/beta fold hydrolase [Alphaproteobacteria bacterium]
ALVGANTWTHGDPYFNHVFRFRKGLLEQGRVDLYASAGTFMLWPPDWIAANIVRVERDEKIMRDNFPDPRVGMARIDAITRFDRRHDLPRIKVPTLIVGCDDDMVTPAYFSRDLARLIPGARLEMLPNGGHSCYQTRVPAWNRTVLNFLRSVPKR